MSTGCWCKNGRRRSKCSAGRFRRSSSWTGRAFVGFIDRLDRDERTGDIGVVDYKTGSIATSAAEYGEKVRRFRDFQLPFYYWARTAAGDRVTKLVLIPLKDALLDVRPVVLEVGKTIKLDDLEAFARENDRAEHGFGVGRDSPL